MNRKILHLAVSCLLLAALAGCHREKNYIPVNDAETVTAGITGMVIDENNLPVANALVQAGGQSIQTDRYGFFRLSNITLSKANAAVKVQRSGYFTAFRTFYAASNRSHYIRIKLLPKTNTGSFTAGTGGTITLPGGAQLEMPAAAVTDANGNPYNGTVNAAMTWIDPTSTDLTALMPGDLRGITTTGAERALESYGMIGAELTTPGGQPLKIAAGKTARLTFPLPATLQAAAPATIALWHFDEATARWKEEGTAVKTGGSYVATVSHFSFWNCDAPFPVINLCMTLVNGNRQPLNYTPVRIRRLNAGPGGTVGYGFTDSAGHLCGAVPQNEPLVLEVLAPCGMVAYSQNIGPFAASTSLGNIIVNFPGTTTFTVTGQVTDCSGAPVTNGSFILFQPNGFSASAPVVNGSFSLQVLNCQGQPVSFSGLAINNATLQQSNAVGGTGNTGTINLGTLQACNGTTPQFIQITIDGTPYIWTAPPDTMGAFTTIFAGFPGPFASVYTYRLAGGQLYNVMFSFPNPVTTPAAYPMRDCTLNLGATSSSTIVSATPLVNITELGPLGTGFIAGNYSIQMAFSTPPIQRTVSCQFRVRRF